MTDQHPDNRDAERVRFDIFKSIDRLRLSAWLTVALERLWPLVLPLLLVAAAFLSLSWFGVFRMLPDWPRLVLLALFVLSLPACLYLLTRFRLPDHAEISRRLENVNDLDHQPISVQSEQLVSNTNDPFAQALWDEHRKRMAERIRDLKSGLPQTRVPEHDPWALRAVLGLLLFIAFAFSGGPLGGRVSDAFRSHGKSDAVPPRIDAWVTPPRYTGRAPVFLTSAANTEDKQFTIPQDSTLVIRIIGGSGSEKVAQTAADGDAVDIAAKDQAKAEDTAAVRSKPRNFEVPLHADSTVTLSSYGTTLSAWSFAVIPDQPPSIRFTKDPTSAINGTMEVFYELKDDYGAASALASIEQAVAGDKDARPLYTAPDLPLALPRRGEQPKETKTTKDLTEHPWAGSEIRMTLIALDDAKQEARSETKILVMPERPFANPLARAVVEQRRVLALNANAKPEVLNTLDALTIWPEETIKNASHYLALRSIRSRLNLARSDDQLREVVAYMWQVARGIEDGALSDAERRLRQAQEALKQALERGASPEEIEKLMAELRQAMNEYLREFAERAQKNPNMAQTPDPNARELRQEDINRMLDQIEDLAKQGSKDQAQQLLSELENMMNNLQMGQQQQQSQQGRQMRQQMDKLGELMRRQQDMMNQTHRLEQQRQKGMQQDYGQNQQGQEGNQGQMSEEDIAKALRGLQEDQNKLQSDLEQMMKDLRGLGVNPGKDFGEAGKSMGEAGESLGEADGGQAVDQQSNALDALRRGGQDMMKQMQQAMEQDGQTGGRRGGQQNGRQDPLGRPQRSGDQDFFSRDMVPKDLDIQRAREILDEIRRRLGNALSPQVEKDYLERLLKFD
ncbi:TIGR02302 family protein [Phyllobacterium zundukense]|uniref:TIGR02302 family protein n=1 Tax=Phyllobacterium zundukense TaxID=1867719 RepID=A0A2N9W092_9HYPH|nr:TIGR02302 family protein [Phyllobacterium zundukense]ATU90600.1 TIGR02302 family protein [Phyllobacterium zundukense]PIO45160.1 TIGR02302 family protein [Phyllobacterium zundukense]